MPMRGIGLVQEAVDSDWWMDDGAGTSAVDLGYPGFDVAGLGDEVGHPVGGPTVPPTQPPDQDCIDRLDGSNVPGEVGPTVQPPQEAWRCEAIAQVPSAPDRLNGFRTETRQ